MQQPGPHPSIHHLKIPSGSQEETKALYDTSPGGSDHTPNRRNKKLQPVQLQRQDSYNPEAASAQVSDQPKGIRDIQLINTSLGKHFIFNNLSVENRNIVIQQMKHYEMGPNEIVFEQGQNGYNFFVISAGECEVLINGVQKTVLKEGASFGELALMHDSKRSATIKTLTNVVMWGLDRRTFRTAVESVNSQNYTENKQFIESVGLFQILTPMQKESLLDSLSTLNFVEGEKIIKQGDPGDLFYIIKSGNVSCTRFDTQTSQEIQIREMTKGDFFGEQALLYDGLRTATITALNQTKCLSIGRQQLTQVLGEQLQQIIYRNSFKIALERSVVLSRLTKEQVDRMFQNIQITNYANGQKVIAKGTPKGINLWIVLKGQLKSSTGEVISDVMTCIGDGEIHQQPQGNYSIDILANEDTVIASLGRDAFEDAIGGAFETATENNDALKVLKRVQLLRGFTIDRLQNVINVMRIETFNKGDVIVQQNNIGDSFFIIKTGKVDIFKDGNLIRSITKHDYFGERAVLFDDFRSATVVASESVICWVLYKHDFLNVIDDSIRFDLLRRIELQDDSIQLKDLIVVRTLGQGMFGNVFLVVHKEKRSLYALKTVTRKKVQAYDIHANLGLERRILLQLDHIFIMKLIKTFKDDKRIYFLMEFVRGMDLFDVLREMQLVTNEDTRFYVASLIEILDHLHERDIIYRDLKPENIMIDEEGFPKLIDFGTAKFVEGRTFTIVGTPHYMSPEVINGNGYNCTADFWSIGIILFEFLCGGVPFGEDEEDPIAIYQQVLNGQLRFPNWVDPNLPARPLIEQLLDKNPALRTGGSVDNLRAHPWFQGFDFNMLVSKQIRPPFRPPPTSFATEITTALRRNIPLESTIMREEMEEMGLGAGRPLPDGWDADF